jgi:2-dehydro-3-deoxyphosphogluconate aldolase/(4S)-4-hydroxy-2-oxoglutarate aldolase
MTFEFTNRKRNALAIFSKLTNAISNMPNLVLGVGTVMTAVECERFIDAGAAFVVSPYLAFEVGEVCKMHDVSWSPGCGTLSEVMQAKAFGAELIKVFPADVLGPKFIKGVKAPCPGLNLMPTGGVDTSPENLKEWFQAGVHCVGMGSQLIPKGITVNDPNLREMQQKITDALSVIKNIKENASA